MSKVLVSLQLPEELRNKAKEMAAARGLTFTKVVQEALQGWVTAQGGEVVATTAAPSESSGFYIPPEDSDELLDLQVNLLRKCDDDRSRGRMPAERTLRYLDALGVPRDMAMSPPLAKVWEKQGKYK